MLPGAAAPDFEGDRLRFWIREDFIERGHPASVRDRSNPTLEEWKWL